MKMVLCMDEMAGERGAPVPGQLGCSAALQLLLWLLHSLLRASDIICTWMASSFADTACTDGPRGSAQQVGAWHHGTWAWAATFGPQPSTSGMTQQVSFYAYNYGRCALQHTTRRQSPSSAMLLSILFQADVKSSPISNVI